MYCSKCGVQNPDGSTHCSNCGDVLGDISQQPGAQTVPVAAYEPKTCGLATASLVMGLLCLTCVLWPLLFLPAIICGIVALVKIGNKKLHLKGTGLAITGIAIPSLMAILLPFFALLMSILMPAMSRTKTIAQRVVCGTNLKGLSTAMIVYTNDYDDTLPTENWCDLFIEEVDVSPKSFVCPESDAVEGESCYAMNKNIAGMKLGDLPAPANVVLFFETDMGLETGPRSTSIKTRRHYEFLNEFGNVYDQNAMVYKDRFNQFGGPEDLLVRHEDGCNIAFADGHVEFVKAAHIPDLQWTVEE
ncbi:MAG: DUF4190 domain-containing protein [Planctomycetota bacterium]